jgi:hypothetical protein
MTWNLPVKSRSLAQGPTLGAVRYAANSRLTRARDDKEVKRCTND